MPHTSHRRKTAQVKRRQVIDSDGWTRVTNGGQPVPQSASEDWSRGGEELDFKWGIEGRMITVKSRVIAPEYPTPRLSVEQMTAKYFKIHTKWVESTSYDALRKALAEDRIFNGNGAISTCVILGSGSLSASPQGRDEVAYYQIAAFKSAIDTIEQLQGHRPMSLAQEPLYNGLDVAFLATLDISTVDHPKGFECLDRTAFVYSPCAERKVELQIMYHQPRLWLHRELRDLWLLNHEGRPSTVQSLSIVLQGKVSGPENGHTEGNDEDVERHLEEQRYMINHDLHEAFNRTHHSLSLPDLNASNYPFQSCFIHWSVEDDNELRDSDEHNRPLGNDNNNREPPS